MIDTVYNDYSANDKVSKHVYRVVQAGSTAAGVRGFSSEIQKIKDGNVSRILQRHSAYCDHVKLAKQPSLPIQIGARRCQR